MSGKKTLILEYDDLHWKSPENCLDVIEKAVSRYPSIKMSFFCTPMHSYLPLSRNRKWCDAIRSFISSGNICLAVHGLFHSTEEFKDKSYAESRDTIGAAEREFGNAGLPFVKAFRCPQWTCNRTIYPALESLGYSHFYTHEMFKGFIPSESKIKSVIYNWNLKDEAAPEADVIVGHGHTWNVCDNGIKQTFLTMERFLSEHPVEFKFVHEY
jgi:hypothetical protein